MLNALYKFPSLVVLRELGVNLKRTAHRSVIKPKITAKIVADSISQEGYRITTYELEYPRFVHAEFMTHRLFSRNAASSRAIPVEKQIENIRKWTACPAHWGANQSGMQADKECDEYVDLSHFDWELDQVYKEDAWMIARDLALHVAQQFAAAGFHKQIVNRLTEPFSHIKVVCTATEYENFFWLRCHPAAQPEIRILAEQMQYLRESSRPRVVEEDHWHLPYVDEGIVEEAKDYIENTPSNNLDINELLLRISASCCAQVSYRTTDTSIPKALRIYDQLVSMKPVHASPFEHQAKPILPTHNYGYPGITHTTHRDGARWSGNLRGWNQYRHFAIPDNTMY